MRVGRDLGNHPVPGDYWTLRPGSVASDCACRGDAWGACGWRGLSACLRWLYFGCRLASRPLVMPLSEGNTDVWV